MYIEAYTHYLLNESASLCAYFCFPFRMPIELLILILTFLCALGFSLPYLAVCFFFLFYFVTKCTIYVCMYSGYGKIYRGALII